MAFFVLLFSVIPIVIVVVFFVAVQKLTNFAHSKYNQKKMFVKNDTNTFTEGLSSFFPNVPMTKTTTCYGAEHVCKVGDAYLTANLPKKMARVCG